MSRKTRKLIWSAPLLAALAVVGALAVFMAPAPDPAQAHDPPGAVQNLVAMASGPNQVNLTWDAPASGGTPTSYRIERSPNGDVWFALATDLTETAYSDRGLTRTTPYYYRAFAMNAAGPGPVSQDYLVQTAAPTAPGATLGLSATALGQRRIMLSWNPPSDDGGESVTGYSIHWAQPGQVIPGPDLGSADITTSGTGVIELPASAGTTYEHTMLAADTPLEPDTRYRYIIYAENPAGKSMSPSGTASASTFPLTPPGEIRGLTAVLSRGTPHAISLYWYPPTDNGGVPISNYNVELAYNGSDNWGAHEGSDQFNWTNENGVGHLVSAEAQGSGRDSARGFNTYAQVQFRVRAQNGTGSTVRSGDWVYSRLVDFQPSTEVEKGLSPLPADQRTARAQPDQFGNVELTWTPQAPAGASDPNPPHTGWRIDVSDDGVNWELLVSDTGRAYDAERQLYSYYYHDTENKRRWYRIFGRHAQYLGNTHAQPFRAAEPQTVPVGNPGHVESFTAMATGPSEIVLNWAPPINDGGAPVIAYRIDGLRQTATDPGFTTLNAEFGDGFPYNLPPETPDRVATIVYGADNTSYTLGMLSAGDTWRFQVIPITDDPTVTDLTSGAGRHANTATAETRTVTTLQAEQPEAPDNLVAEDAKDSNLSGVADRGVLLLWNKPNPPDGATITGYQVQRMSDGGAWETIADDTGSTHTDYTDTEEPAEGELRAYRVAALSGSIVGVYTDPVYYPHHLTAHNRAPMVGTAIANQTVMVGSTVTVPSTITDPDMGDMLTWNATSDMDAVATAMVDGTGMVTITGMMEGTATITVTAMDSSGESAMQTIMVTVEAAELTAPTNVMAMVDDSNPGAPDVTVTWTDGMGAAQHAVILFDEDFNFGDRIAGQQDDQTHTFQGVPSGTYIAVVVALDDAYEMELAFATVTVP